MRANEYIKKYGIEVAKKAISECSYGYGIDLVDLKHLVESHEYIESFGGLREAKRTFEMRHGVINLDGWDKLKLAIADVESCK